MESTKRKRPGSRKHRKRALNCRTGTRYRFARICVGMVVYCTAYIHRRAGIVSCWKKESKTCRGACGAWNRRFGSFHHWIIGCCHRFFLCRFDRRRILGSRCGISVKLHNNFAGQSETDCPAKVLYRFLQTFPIPKVLLGVGTSATAAGGGSREREEWPRSKF